MSIINPEKIEQLELSTCAMSFSESYTDLLRSMSSLYTEIEWVDPIPVVRDNDTDSTLFTTSGIQYMNRYILGTEVSPDRAFVFSQPVIRMNYFKGVGLGSYTSFVNFGTMQMDTRLSDHEGLIAEYSDILAEHSGSPVEVTDPKEKSYVRDGLEYHSIQSNFVIEGLEVGDTIFHHISQQDGSFITMSELGGGLERAFYGVDGQIIAETTGIDDVNESNVLFADAFRGAVLMAANGVIPSNNNQGYQMRRLIKRLSSTSEDAEFAVELVDTPASKAHEFWDALGGVIMPCVTSMETIRDELFRNINIQALRERGMEPKSKMNLSESPQEFAKRYSLS